MKTILILAASALCVLSAKADDDYATIVRYLGENGHYIISPDAAGDAVAQPAAAETVPSGAPVTHIVVPSITPTPYESIPAEMKGILDQLKYIDMADRERRTRSAVVELALLAYAKEADSKAAATGATGSAAPGAP